MEEKRLNREGYKVVIGTFIGPLIQAALLFWMAGSVQIPRVWLYVVISWVGLFGGIVLVAKVNPELVNHRGQWKKKKDTKKWDKVIVTLYGIIGFYVTAVVAGLDIGRHQWWVLGRIWIIPGVILYLIGSILIDWAMITNKHFETTVRIQEDRGHTTITSGPYQFVRHPGYVGAILLVITKPLIFGSGYAMVPGAIAGALMVVRTVLEDKTLQKELAGYSEYAKKVRYKLVPGIW
jgi:protein-S-isoprenylcysteine O-methyltransferase Ste14